MHVCTPAPGVTEKLSRVFSDTLVPKTHTFIQSHTHAWTQMRAATAAAATAAPAAATHTHSHNSIMECVLCSHISPPDGGTACIFMDRIELFARRLAAAKRGRGRARTTAKCTSRLRAISSTAAQAIYTADNAAGREVHRESALARAYSQKMLPHTETGLHRCVVCACAREPKLVDQRVGWGGGGGGAGDCRAGRL